MANVDEEDVHRRLGWADHILRGCDKLNYGVVDLSARPTVARLILDGIPIEELRYRVEHLAHAATPSFKALRIPLGSPQDGVTNLLPPSTKDTNGLMYIKHFLQRGITASETTGTSCSPSFTLL